MMRRTFALALALFGCDSSLGGRDGELPDGGGGDTPLVIVDGGPIDGGGIDAPMMMACFADPMVVGGGGGADTIDDAVAAGGCSTAVVRPLSEQLIEEIDCLAPGAMGRIDGIGGLTLTATALPWLQRPAVTALAAAVLAGGGGLTVNSTLRTLPQQLMLYRWYRSGLCGITLAASPGRSPHERGLAIDTSQYDAWRSPLEANGYRWHGAGDLVHFDYVGGGEMDLAGLSVLAFQRLWNRNNPGDLIAEDGAYGPQTESRLRMSPVDGFTIGAMCGTPVRAPLVLDWTLSGNRYQMVARAETDVTAVTFSIDGRSLGTASRLTGGTYELDAGACMDGAFLPVVLTATGASDSAVALLEARAESAIFVRPRGASTYEIGLERPAAAVAAIEVSVDGTLLTDASSGTTRSTRNAVLYTFSVVGMRSFEVRSYGGDGALLETRTFGFELR